MLLWEFVTQLLDEEGSLAPDDRVRMSTIVLDLVAALLSQRLTARPVEPPDDGRRALLLRIQTFIEQRLYDTRLSASQIASAHHISVRHLQKLFEKEDLTVAGWIRRRRLDRCRRDLADPAQAGESVRMIAARWGFPSESHFNRIFRAAFGTPPAAYRRRLRESHVPNQVGE